MEESRNSRILFFSVCVFKAFEYNFVKLCQQIAEDKLYAMDLSSRNKHLKDWRRISSDLSVRFFFTQFSFMATWKSENIWICNLIYCGPFLTINFIWIFGKNIWQFSIICTMSTTAIFAFLDLRKLYNSVYIGPGTFANTHVIFGVVACIFYIGFCSMYILYRVL